MKKKLRLKELQLKSFIINFPKTQFILGGEDNTVGCDTTPDTECEGCTNTNSLDRTIITETDIN